jgi:hypothetical protein
MLYKTRQILCNLCLMNNKAFIALIYLAASRFVRDTMDWNIYIIYDKSIHYFSLFLGLI